MPGFQLVRRIGRGGMGEVFHAVRVGPGGFRKTVALKQLVADHLSGRARQRFLEEAQVSAQLEHPNLVRVQDVVVNGSGCFIVMELLRGTNLVDAADALRAGGSVPAWLALEVAVQVLDGLAYAHDAIDDRGKRLGLVHRDLTPRNVFLCTGGIVKVLDFGIAKRLDGPSLTHSGHIHGTIELLSPEQARGERVDRRSDIYQLGATLYWLLANRFPYGDGTAGEIIARAAGGNPTPLGELVSDVPAGTLAVIERAMAARVDDRYADAAAMRSAIAAELARSTARPSLAELVAKLPVIDSEPAATTHTISVTGEHTAAGEPAVEAEALAIAPKPAWRWAVGGLAVVCAAAATGWVVRGAAPAPRATRAAPPTWRQLTLDPGIVHTARFVPGRGSYVYSGHWARPGWSVREATANEGRWRLVLDDARLAAASRDDLLVLLHPHLDHGRLGGTLARIPLAGGGPRELVTDAVAADISPDGTDIAVLRHSATEDWIERPIGTRVFASKVGISAVRISPDGALLAIWEDVQPQQKRVVVIARDGTNRTIGTPWWNIEGIAWSPAGDELWVSGSHRFDKNSLVMANALDGAERLLAATPTGIRVVDVDPEGHALVVEARTVDRVSGDLGGDGHERYLTTIYGRQTILSQDGKYFMFMDDSHAMPDGDIAIYKAPVDGSTEPVRVAEGLPKYASLDGRWLLITSGRQDSLRLVPLGPGEPIAIPLGDLATVTSAVLLADGATVIATAKRAGQAPRLYSLDVRGGRPPRELGPAHVALPDAIQIMDLQSPDGTRLVVRDVATKALAVLQISDGSVVPIPPQGPNDQLAAWRADGRAVIVRDTPELNLIEIELATGARRVLRTLDSLDDTGEWKGSLAWISSDLRRYIKWETQKHSYLFAVEGLQ